LTFQQFPSALIGKKAENYCDFMEYDRVKEGGSQGKKELTEERIDLTFIFSS